VVLDTTYERHVGQQQYRFLQGQRLQLHTICNTNVTLRAWARIIYDDGSDAFLSVPEVARNGNRVEEDLFSDDIAVQNGWVVAAVVEMVSADVKRGQAYVRLTFAPFGCHLLQDYCYSFGDVCLGTLRTSGPAGGDGHKHVITAKAAGDAAASLSYVLVQSNMVRKILGYAYYFETSSGVATRVLSVTLRQPLGNASGTMADAGLDVWEPGALTMTASEDGTMYADEKLSMNNDNGVLAVDSEPTPFPLVVTEEMDPDYFLIFAVANLDGNDDDAIYVFVEEWIVP